MVPAVCQGVSWQSGRLQWGKGWGPVVGRWGLQDLVQQYLDQEALLARAAVTTQGDRDFRALIYPINCITE